MKNSDIIMLVVAVVMLGGLFLLQLLDLMNYL